MDFKLNPAQFPGFLGYRARGVHTVTRHVTRIERQRVQSKQRVHSCQHCVRRNRRHSSSEYSTSSGFSSCSSPEGQTGVKHDTHALYEHVQRRTMDEITSTASFHTAHVQKSVVKHAHVHSTQSASPASMASRASAAPSTSRIKVFIRVQGQSDETCLKQIYKPVLDMIDPKTDIIDFIDDAAMDGGKWPLVLFGGCKDMKERAQTDELMMPALGLVLLLQEQEIVGSDRLQHITEYMQRPPWKFHHSEWVAAHRIKAYPYNSLDYFFVADELPVCSVRQVHGTKEHLRVLRYVTHENWIDSFNLYKLIINKDPDYYKSDFCVFTVETHTKYTVQFALKQLPKGISLAEPCHTVLSFQVRDIGALVPLLPHSIQKLCDIRWQTTDLDGNELLLEVNQNPNKRRQKPRPRSRAKSQSSRRSSSSTTSFASILLDTAEEFIAADEVGSNSVSVVSEPYVYSGRKEFGLDESSSSSTTHSVLGFESSRLSVSDSPSLKANQARSRTPLNVGEAYSVPESRRFAWVREMMEADSKLRTNGQNFQQYNQIPHNGHQHTDSGFGEEKSDEGERNIHGDNHCTNTNKSGIQVNRHHCNGHVVQNTCHFSHCNGNFSMPPMRQRSNSHGNNQHLQRNNESLDACDEEIERMRLLQSNPNLSQISNSPRIRSGPNLTDRVVLVSDYSRGQAGSLQQSLRRRRTADILPNRVELCTHPQQQPPLTAYQQNVLNIRARGFNPACCHQQMNQNYMPPPELGIVPPRCTSTPLIHSPRSVVSDTDKSGDEFTSKNTIREVNGPNGNKVFLNQSADSNTTENRVMERESNACSMSTHSRSPKPKEDSAEVLNRSERYFPDIGIGMESPQKSGGTHKPGTPVPCKQSAFAVVHPRQKEKLVPSENISSKNATKDISSLEVAVEVHSEPKSRLAGHSPTCKSLKSSSSQNNLDHPQKFQKSRDVPKTPRNTRMVPVKPPMEHSLPEAEESFEEAAIDCPVTVPNKSKTVTHKKELSTGAKNTYSGLTKTRDSLSPKTANCSPDSYVTLRRSKVASKMVTFAEEVQEKDISICMDDVTDSEAECKQRTPKDVSKMGFWI